MRKLPNKKLSPHFSRWEIIEGAALPREAIKMNWDNIKQYSDEPFEPLLEDMEAIRSLINILYKTHNRGREIGMRVTSGWRCRQWELQRGRSGNSQHVRAAIDFQPSNCSDQLAVEIMSRMHEIFWAREDGYPGGYAIAYPKRHGNVLKTLGFLHFDRRGQVARWKY